MTLHLTTGQRALLRAELVSRQHQLQRRLAEHHAGLSRADHAHELREQDADDVPQREGERGLDMALSDMEMVELGRVDEALRRIDGPGYGLCAVCDEAIPFDRLKVESWALRCVACQARHEAAA